MTLTGNYGVTDRFDIGGAIPFVRVSLQGQRVDTYRGRELVQATGSASASGLGDVVVRAKYNVLRDGGERPCGGRRGRDCRPATKRTCSAPGARASHHA